jgi:hypothetical protein
MGSDMETPDESVVLAGTANSDFNIVSVTWRNSRGGQGQAASGEQWRTSGIPLEPGNNTITITATDSSGASGKTEVVIVRESEIRGSTTLSWMAPTHREDGSPLTNLAGYRLKYGRLSGIYDYQIDIDNPGIVTYVVENLDLGTWYFVASAYDGDEIESHVSNEVARILE